MVSFQNYNGLDKLEFLRKTIWIGEIRVEGNYRRDSILGDMPLKSTARINSQEVRTLERPLSESPNLYLGVTKHEIQSWQNVSQEMQLWINTKIF
jgi:hypothetical protein